MPKLVIFRGDAVENELRLAGRTVRIGRDNRNEVVLDDKSVSRFHAEVRAEGDTYFIVDLKSRNGVWVNGHQAKGKTPLALGAPVTLGAYELALEDDVPTGEFDDVAPLPDQSGAGNTSRVDKQNQPGRSATQKWSTASPATVAKRTAVFWSGLVLTTLLLCGVTYAVFRYRARPATIVEVINPPPTPASPPVRVVQPVQPPAEDPTKATTDRHLADARAAIEGRDFATALRDHLAPVLELDPGNQEALELKRQAEAGSRAKPAAVAVVTPPPPPVEVETPGIARKTGEASPDYTARVKRVTVNLQEGKNSLAKQEFALALARFRLVEADQPRYQGVDLLITETLDKQRKAFEEAMAMGQQAELANTPRLARQWYQRAQHIDPNSTTARDKDGALLSRVTPQANGLLVRATSAMKTGDTATASRIFRQITELLLPGDDISERATKALENLKQ